MADETESAQDAHPFLGTVNNVVLSITSLGGRASQSGNVRPSECLADCKRDVLLARQDGLNPFLLELLRAVVEDYVQ